MYRYQQRSARKGMADAAQMSMTFSEDNAGMRVMARIPLRAGMIVSVSSSLEAKNATRTLTESW